MSRAAQMTTRGEILRDMLARGWYKRDMAARFGRLPRNLTPLMEEEGIECSLSDSAADRRYAKTGLRKTAMIEPRAEVIMRIFQMRMEGKQDADIGRQFHVSRWGVQQSETFMPEIAILKDMLGEQKMARRRAMKRLHALGLTVQRIADLFGVKWVQAEHQIHAEQYTEYSRKSYQKRRALSEVHRKDAQEEAEAVRQLRSALQKSPWLREAWEELVGMSPQD